MGTDNNENEDKDDVCQNNIIVVMRILLDEDNSKMVIAELGETISLILRHTNKQT